MLIATKLDRMVTHLEWPLSIKSHDHIITAYNLARSLDKLKSLYIHYHNAYGHQT